MRIIARIASLAMALAAAGCVTTEYTATDWAQAGGATNYHYAFQDTMSAEGRHGGADSHGK